jgi:hypothetical protein
LFKKGVETLEIGFPKAAVLLQPQFKFPERGGTQGVNAALCVDANVNQAGNTENAQMLGDLGLTEAQAMDHESDRAGTAAQQLDNLEPVGFGEGPECGDHGGNQDAPMRIFLSRHILAGEYRRRHSSRTPEWENPSPE